MIRIIKYGKMYYIFPGMNDPLEWAYHIFRHNNPDMPGVNPVPKGKMSIALTEKSARMKADKLRRDYNVTFPDNRIRIDTIKELNFVP